VSQNVTHSFALSVVALACLSYRAHADDWPQWHGPFRDGVWREQGILDRFPAEGLAVKWRTTIGPGFSGPAVAGGRVFVMDLAVDKNAAADVKTEWNYRDKLAGRERVLCLDERTGQILWTYDYPCAYSIAYGSGPRATPTMQGDRVYTLGAMGDLCCLDVMTGKLVWKKSFRQDYGAQVPLYGFAGAPLVDGDRLIVTVGGTDQAVVALDRHTGRELWKSLSSPEPGYCAPLACSIGGKRQLIIWLPDALVGLEPESGKLLWSIHHPVTAGMAISTPAIESNRLAVSSQYEGAMMLEFKEGTAQPAVLWKASAGSAPERQWKKAGFNTTLSTVLLLNNHVYGVSLYGETCCLDGDTGQRMWTTLEPTSGGDSPHDRWSTLFITPHGKNVFIVNEKGDLILARLTPAGYDELSRAHIIDADMQSSGNGGRRVVWSHPAYANRCIFARNNHEIVCVSLARLKD
jgi:outer membrane protein assembly factor BamB